MLFAEQVRANEDDACYDRGVDNTFLLFGFLNVGAPYNPQLSAKYAIFFLHNSRRAYVGHGMFYPVTVLCLAQISFWERS